MNELDRIKILIKHLIAYGFAENQKGIGVLLGYNNESSFSQIINGKVKTPKNFIQKLKNIEPRLNINWLETGNGSMLLNVETDINTKGNAKPKMISELEVTIAPLISQYAQAGYLCGYADPEYLEKQPPYVATKKYSGGNYVAFEIRGDSMDNDKRNAICNGDVVLGRELYKHYWTCKLHVPKVFIIVHQTEGILLKEIIDHDVEHGIITCHSYNPDKDRYPDFTLNLAEVQQLFYMKEWSRGSD